MDSEWSMVKQYLYVSFCAVCFNASDNSFSMQIAEGEALRKAGVQKEVGDRRGIILGHAVSRDWLSHKSDAP